MHQFKIVMTLLNCNLSISTTGDTLKRVQSSISHQLKLLEDELGGTLFKRRGKRLVDTTPLCRALIPEIEKISSAQKNIQLIAEENKSPHIGALRVATTHTQARYFLPQVMHYFRKKYQKVKLNFNLNSSTMNFYNLLRRNEVDVAVFAKEGIGVRDMVSKKCYAWNRSLIVPPKHPLATQEISLQAVAQYPIVTYTQGFADRDMIDRAFQKAAIDFDIVLSTSDTGVIKKYVELNLGVGIVAQMAKESTNDKLKYRSLAHLFKESTTCVTYLKDRTLRTYMKDFIGLCEKVGHEFEHRLQK